MKSLNSGRLIIIRLKKILKTIYIWSKTGVQAQRQASCQTPKKKKAQRHAS